MRERYKEFLQRSLEEKEREELEDLRAMPVPFYGLPPAFQGPRTVERRRIAAVGRWARDLDRDTVHSQLIHGNRQERPLRFLVVATSRHPEPARQPTPLRHFLWESVVMEMVAMRRGRWRVARISTPKREDVGGPERPVTVPIDHAPQTFMLIETDQAQVAELNLPDHRIILQANRWPIEDTELVTVTDLSPYLEGRRRAQAQLRARLGMNERDQGAHGEPMPSVTGKRELL
jgi:hypothetical protein